MWYTISPGWVQRAKFLWHVLCSELHLYRLSFAAWVHFISIKKYTQSLIFHLDIATQWESCIWHGINIVPVCKLGLFLIVEHMSSWTQVEFFLYAFFNPFWSSNLEKNVSTNLVEVRLWHKIVKKEWNIESPIAELYRISLLKEICGGGGLTRSLGDKMRSSGLPVLM